MVLDIRGLALILTMPMNQSEPIAVLVAIVEIVLKARMSRLPKKESHVMRVRTLFFRWLPGTDM
jgi:hypothetical protein